MEENSSFRSPCPYFGRCGGCQYMDMTYEEELKAKEKKVLSLISEPCGQPSFKDTEGKWVFEGIRKSPLEYGYRNKMEFSFGDEVKGGPLALGLHRKKSYYSIVDMDNCLICPEDMNLIRNCTRDYFGKLYNEGRIDFVSPKDHKGYLRHLLLRRGMNTKENLICLDTASASNSLKLKASEEEEIIQGYVREILSLEGKLKGKIAGICHIYNDALSDKVQSDKTEVLYGRDYIYEEICGLKFRISIFSFFQTNPLGAEVLYGTAREYALEAGGGPLKVIYDLYSGTGTISEIMSKAAEEVYGIEIVEEAVAAARENAKINNISNVFFLAGDVLKVLEGEEGKELPRPDMIILDPPREGVNAKALGKILGFGCENIVYISCRPTSLARELPAFGWAGYRLVKARCIDMFPHTDNVETAALLTKA